MLFSGVLILRLKATMRIQAAITYCNANYNDVENLGIFADMQAAIIMALCSPTCP